MKQLVYGILPADHDSLRNPPLGIGDTEVQFLIKEGLAAVYSPVPEVFGAPDVARLLTYARVIEELFQRGTVLPMRYGCLLENNAAVEQMLTLHHPSYQSTLDRVDGCVEMGLRILPTPSDLVPANVEEQTVWSRGRQMLTEMTSTPEVSAGKSQSGIAYLTSRKNRFDQVDQQLALGEQIANRLREDLRASFVLAVTEKPLAGQSWLISVHFLVRRELINAFSKDFHQIKAPNQKQMLLTGPWPTYNFVA